MYFPKAYNLTRIMEGVRTFLESSTIHGLSYISTTRKCVRLFWVLVVSTGFTGAGFLIYESFQSWAESPVKTTIETLEISKLNLPKVTVCPPKNTFTDLNYDLMLAENMTLKDEERNELYEDIVEIIESHTFMDKLNKMIEMDRFYNWYHGITDIKVPYVDFGALNYRIDTYSTSGQITTQYFGQSFEKIFVEKNLYYKVQVYPPNKARSNRNLTLHLKLEKISIKIEQGSTSHDDMQMNRLFRLDFDQTTFLTNFTPPGNNNKYLVHSREVQNEELENFRLDLMPGFSFSWSYSGAEVEPAYKYYRKGKYYAEFVR